MKQKKEGITKDIIKCIKTHFASSTFNTRDVSDILEQYSPDSVQPLVCRIYREKKGFLVRKEYTGTGSGRSRYVYALKKNEHLLLDAVEGIKIIEGTDLKNIKTLLTNGLNLINFLEYKQKEKDILKEKNEKLKDENENFKMDVVPLLKRKINKQRYQLTVQSTQLSNLRNLLKRKKDGYPTKVSTPSIFNATLSIVEISIRCIYTHFSDKTFITKDIVDIVSKEVLNPIGTITASMSAIYASKGILVRKRVNNKYYVYALKENKHLLEEIDEKIKGEET